MRAHLVALGLLPKRPGPGGGLGSQAMGTRKLTEFFSQFPITNVRLNFWLPTQVFTEKHIKPSALQSLVLMAKAVFWTKAQSLVFLL